MLDTSDSILNEFSRDFDLPFFVFSTFFFFFTRIPIGNIIMRWYIFQDIITNDLINYWDEWNSLIPLEGLRKKYCKKWVKFLELFSIVFIGRQARLGITRKREEERSLGLPHRVVGRKWAVCFTSTLVLPMIAFALGLSACLPFRALTPLLPYLPIPPPSASPVLHIHKHPTSITRYTDNHSGSLPSERSTSMNEWMTELLWLLSYTLSSTRVPSVCKIKRSFNKIEKLKMQN